jgi:hypothetical protein
MGILTSNQKMPTKKLFSEQIDDEEIGSIGGDFPIGDDNDGDIYQVARMPSFSRTAT